LITPPPLLTTTNTTTQTKHARAHFHSSDPMLKLCGGAHDEMGWCA